MSLQVVWTVANDGAVNLLDLSTLEPIKTIVSSNEELSVPLDEHEYFPLSSRCAVSSTSNSSLLPSAWLITSPPAKIMKSLTSSFCHYFLHSYFLNGKIPQFHSAPCNSHTMSGTETKLTAWEKDLSPFFKIITTDKWTCMVMTSDGQFVLVGTSLGKLLVWRLEDGALMASLQAHYQRLQFVALTGDSKAVVTGTIDGALKVWLFQDILCAPTISAGPLDAQYTFARESTSVAEPLFSLTNIHVDKVTHIYITLPQNWFDTSIVTSSLDSYCKIYSLVDGNLLASFILPEPITSVLLDPLETTLFAGSLSGKIYLISLEQLRTSTLQPNQAVILFNLIDQDNSLAKNFSILQGQQDQVTSLRLSLDARFLLSSDTLGQVHLWDLSTRIRFKCAKLSSQPVIYLNCTIMPKFMNRHPTKKEADQLAPPSLAPFKKQIANIYEKALCHKDKADKMGGNFEIEHSFSVELKDQYAKLHEAYTKLEQKVLDGIFSTV